MAGAGWRQFTVGQLLTSAQVQTFLQDQAVQVFASAAARTSALGTAVSAGMVSYRADEKALELYAGTAWQPVMQGRNEIINGGFDIWQRGTSFTGAAPYYTADRWQNYRPGAVAGSTYSRQSAGLNGFDYAIRMQRNAGDTNTSYLRLARSFETSQVKSLWGQPLVLSFYARAGANLSSTSNQVVAEIVGGTGTDGSLGGGFTGGTILTGNLSTITTSWARYTLTLSSLSNTYSQLGLVIQFTPTGTAGAADFIEVTGVQLETGLVATPFVRAANTLQGELAACQRYYYRIGGETAFQRFQLLTAQSATASQGIMSFPVTMRAAPTSIEFSALATLGLSDGVGGTITPTAITLDQPNTKNTNLSVGGTGMTAFRNYYLIANNNATAFIAVSSEL
jgi:hypothetical protein